MTSSNNSVLNNLQATNGNISNLISESGTINNLNSSSINATNLSVASTLQTNDLNVANDLLLNKNLFVSDNLNVLDDIRCNGTIYYGTNLQNNLTTKISTIETTLNNVPRLNQANSFTSTGEHLFNGLIRVARIEPRQVSGGEVYSESPWRINNDNVFYKDGTNGYKNLRNEINSINLTLTINDGSINMLNNKTTDIAYVNNSTTINSLVVNNAFVNQSIIEDGFVLSSNTSVSFPLHRNYYFTGNQTRVLTLPVPSPNSLGQIIKLKRINHQGNLDTINLSSTAITSNVVLNFDGADSIQPLPTISSTSISNLDLYQYDVSIYISSSTRYELIVNSIVKNVSVMNLGYKPIIYNDVNFTLDPDRAFYLLNNSDVQTITFPTNLGDKYDGYIYKFKRTRVGSVVRNTIFRIDNSQNRFLKTDNTADNSFSPSGSPYYFEIMWKSDFNGGMYIVLFSS